MSKFSKFFLSVFILILFSAGALPVYAAPLVKILLPANGFTTDKNTLAVQVYFNLIKTVHF